MERIQLEGKKDNEEKKVAVANRADALALSFAFPVVSRSLSAHGGASDRCP